MARGEALALAALLACAACALPDAPDGPRPTGMSPAAGQDTLETAVEIVGERFHVQGVRGSDGGSTIDASYRAWLGTTALLDVVWVDEATLRARVPAGLAPGPHDLVVEGPHGSGALAAAFAVVGTPPPPPPPPPPATATIVADDPFGDGTPFAFVASYRGQVYAGPNRTGTGLVRMAPDGTALESLPLSFSRDTVGNTSGNSAVPYRSIGFYGCATNSLANACGPDNENGRGFMTSVVFKGEEWLVLGGAKTGGDLDYVYLSRSAEAPLAFSYVDLSQALGGNTRGFSAAAVAGDRLYLGFPDNGGNRPYGLALLAPPPLAPVPGLDAIQGTHVLDLDLHGVYDGTYKGFASVTMVDAIAELSGRVYFFNDLGCVASRNLAPATKADFTACSPADGAAYVQSHAVEPTRQYDIEPWERAWPAAVAWHGRLLAIRNTTTGPQLWRCDPQAGSDPLGCDRDDWTLVAADSSLRTRFGRPDAIATLLLATRTELWIGFDGPQSGVRLFRTSAEVPSSAADFRGEGGCAADEAGCEGVGGDSFGVRVDVGGSPRPALTRIFDAKVVEWSGGSDLVLAAGDGTGPARIVRVAP